MLIIWGFALLSLLFLDKSLCFYIGDGLIVVPYGSKDAAEKTAFQQTRALEKKGSKIAAETCYFSLDAPVLLEATHWVFHWGWRRCLWPSFVSDLGRDICSNIRRILAGRSLNLSSCSDFSLLHVDTLR